MANIRNGNTFYIDTQYSVATDELLIKGVRITYLFLSSSSTGNQIVLADSVTGAKKLSVQNINNPSLTGDTRFFHFQDYPMLFPNGIRPTTLVNMVATCMIIDPRG